MPTFRTLMVAVLATAGVGLVAPQQASASTSVGTSARSQVRAVAPSFNREVLRLTNQARKRHGVRPLTAIRCADRTAHRWARVMATRTIFRHQPRRTLARGCGTRYVGENIAMGRPLSAALVVRLWMSSKGHRANILNPRYRHLGVGSFRSLRTGHTYVVQNFRR